jgi:uncharacterized protein (DUF885 family)
MSEQKRLWPAVFIAAIALSHLCFSPASHSTADPCLQTPSSRLVQEVGDAYFAWIKEDSLYLRVRLGLRVERLPDITPAKAERDAAKAKALLAQLDRVKPEELTHEEELSFDVLRLRLSGLIDEIRRHLETQWTKGVVIPREEIDLVTPFLRALSGDIESSPLGVKPDRLKSLSEAEVSAFRNRVAKTLERKVHPALTNLISYIDGDYRRKAAAAVGLAQHPDGKEYYAWLAKYHTGLNITPEEVHTIGLREVEKINREMDRIQAALGFKGKRSEFRESLKKDPRFFPRTPEEVGERVMVHIRRIEPKIDLYFLRRPKAPYGVKRLDPEREGAMTFGYYEAPTATSPTGYYRYNASRLPERSLLNSAELIYHELIPGHHFEVNLSLENPDIPAFRWETHDTAYSEGWAEYAATLAGEMGMYADPYNLYGRLSGEMFLATRLVVDTGMNALGWSRAQAVAFMRENLMETDAQLHTESLRYSCDIPGQALGYRMGFLKFLELREKAQKALGKCFDIRRFHDALLSSGSLPLATLERHIDWFIKGEKQRAGL